MLTNFKLFEGKQVGLLYHWTYIEPLEKILKDDKMWSGMNYISFSRNKNLNFNNRPVKITFDGNAMSNKFKFIPHLYMKDLKFKEEAEERIECNEFSEPETEYNRKARGWEDMISGVKKYIVDIEINCEEFIFNDTEKIEKELRKLQTLSPVKIKTNIDELKKARLWGMIKPKYQFLTKDAEKLFAENMITDYKIFEDTQNQKFEIPEQIREYYIIEGDMSNTKNWRSTKYFSRFALRDEFKESGLGIRYVLISLDSNHIIPINMNDEHKVGYDVLENEFYPKYKVPRENYISVCTWGTHYIYHIENKEEREEELKVFKKFLEYGGNPKNIIHFYGTEESKRNDYEMTVEQFLETEGSYEEFQTKIIKSGKISNNGEELIKILEEMTLLWEEYVTTDKERRKEYIQKQFFDLAQNFDHFLLMKSSWDGFLNNTDINKHRNKLNDAIDSSNIEELGRILFSHNGIKNFIHMKMKDPKYKKETKEFFWNVKKALSEFNRLSSI